MKANLFDKEKFDQQINSFKPNSDFQSRFNARKKREELERLKSKFGEDYDNPNSGDDQSNSSSISEDESAALDDEEMNFEFLTTLAKIKGKHPDVYKSETKFFDFDVESYARRSKNKEGKEKERPKLTAKQILTRGLKNGEILDSDEEGLEKNKLSPQQENNSENEANNKLEKTQNEIQRQLKADFLSAANISSQHQHKDPERKKPVGEFEGDLLVKKPKNQVQSQAEETEFLAFLERQSKRLKSDEKSLVLNFWTNQGKDKDKQKETSEDLFLKNYIINKRWKESQADFQPSQSKIDQEDERMDPLVDSFEQKYNFRFEEPGGRALNFHARTVPDSIRQELSKRKEQRERALQNQAEKKGQVQQEVEFLRQAKRDKITERIAQIRSVSGASDPEFDKVVREALAGDFDANYDRLMDQLFGEQYYQAPEEDDGQMQAYLRTIEQTFDREFQPKPEPNTEQIKPAESPLVQQEKEEGLLPRPTIPVHLRHNISEPEAKALGDSLQNIWWFCDLCLRGIRPLEPRFDCLTCADHSECKGCAEAKTHEHRLKRFVVPEGCLPPPDEEIRKLAARFKFCSECGEKIPEGEGHYQGKKQEEVFICGSCIAFIGQGKKLRDFSEVAGRSAAPEPKEAMLEDLLSDYRALDFEDVIAGELKTRLEYVDVRAEGFGLTDAELLFADDRLLNQMVSVKKLAPFKEAALSPKDREKIRKMRTLVKESAEKNQKRFLKETELLKREEELRQLSKKSAKAKKEYEVFMSEKEEKMREIYAEDKSMSYKIHLSKKAEEDLKEEDKEEENKSNVKALPISKSRLESYGIGKEKKNG